MRRFSTLSVLFALTLVLTGCQSADTDADNSKAEGGDGDGPASPLDQSVRGIMVAKQAHAHGVLEGLARKDFEQIADNARSLHDLSNKAEWGVHRTMEYNHFSDQFRWQTRELKRHAEEKKLHAATLDYMQLVMTCVRCHDYMAQENLVRAELDAGYLAVRR